jgi:hypothetical protein
VPRHSALFCASSHLRRCPTVGCPVSRRIPAVAWARAVDAHSGVRRFRPAMPVACRRMCPTSYSAARWPASRRRAVPWAAWHRRPSPAGSGGYVATILSHRAPCPRRDAGGRSGQDGAAWAAMGHAYLIAANDATFTRLTTCAILRPRAARAPRVPRPRERVERKGHGVVRIRKELDETPAFPQGLTRISPETWGDARFLDPLPVSLVGKDSL